MSEQNFNGTVVYCPICGSSNKWLNVDEYRGKAEGMHLCQDCGMVTYPQIVADEKKLLEYYRKEYRPAPSVNNLFTGQNKLHYHANFLNDLLKEWKEKKRDNPHIFEIGSAFGMFLDMLRKSVPGATVQGSELTLSFRRVAYHEYGFQLVEDFDDTKKWDLIASYKVLEHQCNPQRELRRYAESLKSDGYLYISVPTWFHTMSNFGIDGFSLAYYYDKNHVNVWTRKLFETLLKKCGLEVVKSNYVYYDSTYLCKRNDELMKGPFEYENATEIIDKLSRIKKASDFAEVHDHDNAMKTFNAFPDALLAHYEKNRAKYHQMGFEKIVETVIKPSIAACPESHKVRFFCADICKRYEQLEMALDYFSQCLNMKPGDAGSIAGMADCYRLLSMKIPERSVEFITNARNLMRELNKVSLRHSNEAITWIFADDAKIPMPGEKPNAPEAQKSA